MKKALLLAIIFCSSLMKASIDRTFVNPQITEKEIDSSLFTDKGVVNQLFIERAYKSTIFHKGTPSETFVDAKLVCDKFVPYIQKGYEKGHGAGRQEAQADVNNLQLELQNANKNLEIEKKAFAELDTAFQKVNKQNSENELYQRLTQREHEIKCLNFLNENYTTRIWEDAQTISILRQEQGTAEQNLATVTKAKDAAEKDLSAVTNAKKKLENLSLASFAWMKFRRLNILKKAGLVLIALPLFCCISLAGLYCLISKFQSPA